MLVPHHLLLFLEISDDLRQTLLEDLDLVLVGLDLVGLHGGSLRILLFCAHVNRNISLNLPIVLFLPRDLLLVLLQFVTLCHRLVRQIFILLMNLTLNRLNR